METILVTGGAGFIGSNFVKLFAEDYNIVVFDSFTYASDVDYIRSINCKIELGDIRNFNHVTSIINRYKPRYIVNFAAESHVDNSIDCPLIFVETNIVGTSCILEAVRLVDFECRLVQVSTDEVYGSTLDASFTEDSHLNPSSPYSSTKASADLIALSYGKTYGLDVVITNSSNNYGPNQHSEKLVPKTIYNAINHIEIPIYGNGGNIRDWLHVNDNVSAIRLVMERGLSGERYNIGGGNEKTNIEIAHKICDIVDQIKGVFGSPRTKLIKFVTDRPAHDARYSVDCSKIMKELDWKPTIDFNNGIESTIKWYMHTNKASTKYSRNKYEPLLVNSLSKLLELSARK